MKKIIISMLLAMAAIAATAQPKAIGGRLGVTGLEASYEHIINGRQFIEADLGLDFGYAGRGQAGVKLTGTYNFIWACPDWTSMGTWAIYAGPGISVGMAEDMVVYTIGDVTTGYRDHGFMLALAAQVGIEYRFDFPLQLALDLRPCFGVHMNDGKFKDPNTGLAVEYGGKTNFYDNGMMGFIPTLSVRYCF